MLTNLAVSNFRSVEDANVELAPITIFFGPTSAGKSTLFYSLMVLRNFILNPNQAVDGFFNLGFQNLGGFEACVFNHVTSKAIRIMTSFVGKRHYGIELGKSETEIISIHPALSMKTKVPIPYGANQSLSETIMVEQEEYTVTWNGFAFSVAPTTPANETQATSKRFAQELSKTVEDIKAIDICPHRRGFFKPTYSPGQVSPIATNEDEVATIIINDQNIAARISINTDEIFDRDFRTYTAPGTATVYFQTTERTGARIPGNLVNDGFGVNQVVYLLAKIHRPEVRTMLIEEPEVHLHPTVIRKLANVMAKLSIEEEKQLVFTTHSEQFLLSMLACVKKGILRPENLKCYYVERVGKKSSFTNAEVSPNGQISGGLTSFMEGELEDIKTFLASAAAQ